MPRPRFKKVIALLRLEHSTFRWTIRRFGRYAPGVEARSRKSVVRDPEALAKELLGELASEGED
jgi:hypothetical protein